MSADSAEVCECGHHNADHAPDTGSCELCPFHDCPECDGTGTYGGSLTERTCSTCCPRPVDVVFDHLLMSPDVIALCDVRIATELPVAGGTQNG